ncbi:MAG TPA: hypothetical protein VF868_05060 [Bacteroidia bacterium]|jgi:hypothetical protein
MRLKNTISCILVFMISLAYSYETVEYFIKAIGDEKSIVWVDDNECEEKSEEKSKETEESKKSEGISLSSDPYLQQQRICNTKLSTLGSNQNTNFSSSDYSLEIYCPPELA